MCTLLNILTVQTNTNTCRLLKTRIYLLNCSYLTASLLNPTQIIVGSYAEKLSEYHIFLAYVV